MKSDIILHTDQLDSLIDNGPILAINHDPKAKIGEAVIEGDRLVIKLFPPHDTDPVQVQKTVDCQAWIDSLNIDWSKKANETNRR